MLSTLAVARQIAGNIINHQRAPGFDLCRFEK